MNDIVAPIYLHIEQINCIEREWDRSRIITIVLIIRLKINFNLYTLRESYRSEYDCESWQYRNNGERSCFFKRGPPGVAHPLRFIKAKCPSNRPKQGGPFLSHPSVANNSPKMKRAGDDDTTEKCNPPPTRLCSRAILRPALLLLFMKRPSSIAIIVAQHPLWSVPRPRARVPCT